MHTDSKHVAMGTANYSRAMHRAKVLLAASIPMACLAASGTSLAASYYWDPHGSSSVGGTGNWLGGSFWSLSSSGGSPVLWVNGNDAIFAGSQASATVTTSSAVTASSLQFTSTGYTLSGSPITIATGGSATLPAIDMTVSKSTTVINNNLSSTAQLVMSNTGTPRLDLWGSNSFAGGIDIQGAMRLDFNSPTAAGNTAADSNATISVETTGTIITNANTVPGQIAVGGESLNVPMAVNLNPTNATPFAVAMGATTAGGGTGSLTLNWEGPISGNSDVVIGNDPAKGGGAAMTMFSNPNNTYTGKTIVDNTSSFGVFRMGCVNALPVTTDLQFGSAAGGRQDGMLDLNNFNTEVGSLSTDFGASETALGITNSGTAVATLTIGGHSPQTTNTYTYSSIIGAVSTLTGPSQGGVSGNNNEALVYSSTDLLVLAGANTYTGGTTINSGTIQLGTGTGSLSSAGALVMTGGTFDINGQAQQVTGLSGTGGTITSSAVSAVLFTANIPSGTSSFAGTINNGGGTVAFTKSGSGKLVFTGAHTYTGNTNVLAGSLIIDSPGSLANTNVVVTTNATLGGNGTIAGGVTVNGGGIVSPGDSIGTLNVGSLNLGANSNLKFDLGGGSGSDSIAVAGGLTLPGSSTSINPVVIDINNAGSIAAGNTYTLISNPSGSLTGDTGHLYLRTLPSGFAYSLVTSPTAINLQVRALGTAETWTGNSNSAWNSTASNWTAGTYNDDDPVTFDDNGKNTNITVASAVNPGPITFNNSTAVSYTIGGAAIAGQTTLTKNNTGTVTLTSSNTFSGTLTIANGTLSVSSDANLGNVFNQLVIGSGTTGTLQATSSFTTNRVMAFNGTAAFDVTAGNILTLTGILEGTGGLSTADIGTLALSSNSNSYQGATNIGTGSTLLAGAAGVIPSGSDVSVAGTFNLGSYNQTVGSIAGAGSIVTASSVVLTTGGDGASTTFSGVISGAGTIAKSGSGTLTLGGANTFGGSGVSLAVSAGTLAVSSDSNLGAAQNSVVLADGTTLALNTSTAAFSTSRAISLTAGTTGSATVSVSGGNNATLSGLISGNNGLTKAGSDTLTLTNAGNTFTALNITGGAVATSSDTAIGTGTVTFSNGGALQINSSFSTSKPFAVSTAGGSISLGGNTLTYSGSFTGGQNTGMTLNGTGTLILSRGGSKYQSSWNINGPTLVVNAVDANGIGGVGTGGTTSGQLVNNSIHPVNGGIFQIDNVNLGSSTSTANAPRIYLDNNGTLLADGTSSYGYQNGGLYIFRSTDPNNPTNTTIATKNATDVFTIPNEILQVNHPTDPSTYSGVSNAVINVSGPGTVLLTTGDLNGTSIYAGSWNIKSGTVQLGPVVGNAAPAGSSAPPFGEPLTALGFANGDPDQPNPVTLTGGVLAVGVDSPNENPGWTSQPQGTALNTAPNYLRDPITLAGGAIASTGFEVSYDPNNPANPQGVATTTPVTAEFGGNFTVAAGTSEVLTYDPQNSTEPARSVELVGGTRTLSSDGNTLTYTTSWVGTLQINPGASSGGSFSILRDSGTFAVTPGAKIQVLQGASLALGGADSLTDGTNFVNVENDSTYPFTVLNGSHRIGVLNGTGNTSVSAGATLSAVSLAQNTLTINGNAVVRAGTPHTVSVVSSLVLAGSANAWTGALDLANTDLIVHGGSVSNITNQLSQGFNNGLWTGTGGIISSVAAAAAVSGSDVTAIGYELNNDGTGAKLLSTFDGQSVSNTDVLLKYTYFGDADLSGTVDGSDYTLIDTGFNNKYTGWHNGDFNYDGVVNGNDYTLIDNAYNNQTLGALSAGASPADILTTHSEEIASPADTSVVPEPATVGLVALGGAGLLMRRRRQA